MSLTPAPNKQVCSIHVAFFRGYIFNLPRLILGKQRSQGGFLGWGTVPEDMFIITEICDVYDGLHLRAIVCCAWD
ncbi:hypothetical protein [Nostoc sp.]|uniref:hypothetical protein n=1 Tax=Nostoc sp. TaxID=1180 RepID=UPI002FF9768B